MSPVRPLQQPNVRRYSDLTATAPSKFSGSISDRSLVRMGVSDTRVRSALLNYGQYSTSFHAWSTKLQRSEPYELTLTETYSADSLCNSFLTCRLILPTTVIKHTTVITDLRVLTKGTNLIPIYGIHTVQLYWTVAGCSAPHLLDTKLTVLNEL